MSLISDGKMLLSIHFALVNGTATITLLSTGIEPVSSEFNAREGLCPGLKLRTNGFDVGVLREQRELQGGD